MARLSDICVINMGQSPDSSTYNEDGNGLPFFQGNADFGVLHPSVRVWCSAPTKIAKPNDILISVRAPIGALNIADVECCIGRGLAALTVDSAVCEQKYLWYGLESKIKELNAKGTGSTFKAISKSILHETEILLPSISKQVQVADTLDKVSNLIALRKQQLEKLDKLVKARFVEMFGDPETNTKGWPISNMCNLCSVGSSKRIYQSEQSSAGIPFWRVSDLTNLINTGVATENLYIPEKRYAELQAQGQVPVEGDILVTSRGTLGQCYIVKATDRFYFQDGMISWLSEYANGITPLYISHLFSMPGFRKQIDSMQAGSTVAYLSIAMIKKLMVMIPNVETQQQFASFVEQIDQCRLTIQRGLDKLEMLKKALMQEY